MTLCAQSASRPSRNKNWSKNQSSALRSPLNFYTQMNAVLSLHRPWETIDTIYTSSTITRGTHLYGCTQIRKPRPARRPTSHFRTESTLWDTRTSDSAAIMDIENTTIRPFGMSSQPVVLHPSHALHTPTIRMVLPNEWSVQSLHQQKTFPSGRNGTVRVDMLRQSRQRHPGGRLLRAQRQQDASRCISPSDHDFVVSYRSVGILW